MKLLGIPLFLIIAALSWAPPMPTKTGFHPKSDPWARLPFTAWEWARQTQLPYRRIPLKNGGSMSVQQAYDLYVEAGQPDYPDMDTPGLVTPEEVAEQLRISRNLAPAHRH